jgi:agmatine deiminase
MKDRKRTPRELGYCMPAEWAAHDATWLSWPHNRDTWPEQLEAVKDIWAQMAAAISPGEKVRLLVDDAAEKREAAERLARFAARMENIELIEIPTVDVWMRDYGPTFVTRRGGEAPLAFNDWIFNGWGNKYTSYTDDDGVAKTIAKRLGVPVFAHDIVLEGGSIEVNGAGICLTTEQCLLNPNRNPHLRRGDLEALLKANLGVEHIVWLADGIVGDDTDGHIDDIARFVDQKTVLCAVEDDAGDENYAPLQENYERLQGARDQYGAKLDIITLPMPGKVAYGGSRLPASYANFYIANEAVLVPTYDHPNDRRALGILTEVFPARKIVPLPSRDVVVGLGAMHCVTQQQPRA